MIDISDLRYDDILELLNELSSCPFNIKTAIKMSFIRDYDQSVNKIYLCSENPLASVVSDANGVEIISNSEYVTYGADDAKVFEKIKTSNLDDSNKAILISIMNRECYSIDTFEKLMEYIVSEIHHLGKESLAYIFIILRRKSKAARILSGVVNDSIEHDITELELSFYQAFMSHLTIYNTHREKTDEDLSIFRKSFTNNLYILKQTHPKIYPLFNLFVSAITGASGAAIDNAVLREDLKINPTISNNHDEHLIIEYITSKGYEASTYEDYDALISISETLYFNPNIPSDIIEKLVNGERITDIIRIPSKDSEILFYIGKFKGKPYVLYLPIVSSVHPISRNITIDGIRLGVKDKEVIHISVPV